MKLFQHKALGGAIMITDNPRYRQREDGVQMHNMECTAVATFAAPSATGDQPWDNAYAAFKLGLASGQFAGSSLFDEETQQYIVGDAGELAA